jgi:HAD superfamily hydrolase (TIGR01458 family)
MRNPLRDVRGLLIDIDGTLLVDDRPVPGGAAALQRLRRDRLPFRLATNTTRRSRGAIAAVLRAAGLAVGAEAIVTPALLARRRILDSGRTAAALLIPDEARADLAGVRQEEDHPDWVVVGDLGRGFTWERLNGAFRALRAGAALIALQKNRCWYAGREDGWVLDAGALVAALEYAAGVEAEVVGKPAAAFFRLALEELGCPARDVLVVGDDAQTDGAGGAAAGCRTALVGTGRSAAALGHDSGFQPDWRLASIADLA